MDGFGSVIESCEPEVDEICSYASDPVSKAIISKGSRVSSHTIIIARPPKDDVGVKAWGLKKKKGTPTSQHYKKLY